LTDQSREILDGGLGFDFPIPPGGKRETPVSDAIVVLARAARGKPRCAGDAIEVPLVTRGVQERRVAVEVEMGLHVAILGSMELRVDDHPVAVAPGKQRALLALLALRAPEPISADAAADALWPAAASPQSLRTLQVTVSRLRRSMGTAAEALETLPAGYRLALEHDAIDARRFEQLTREGARARVDGQLGNARRLLDQALGLWRGPPLADVAFQPFAQGDIARLEELRLTALEERTEVSLALGEHQLVVGELERLACEHPDRERLVRQLMLALYRCGRQAEALAAYREAHRRLAHDLGLEPSAELRQLETAILRRDASLEPPRDDEPTGRAATTMPAPPTPTVGRLADLQALQDLIGTRQARLVTLTGPGGVGKTRLAIELARRTVDRFDAGDAFVSLAEIADPDAVPSAIARAVSVIRLDDETLEQALIRTCGGPSRLLVVDNFEHVAPAASVLAPLHAECPGLTIVVTSREPLHLRAEHVYRVEPLQTPPQDASPPELEASPAGQLFVARARARGPLALDSDNAYAIAEVCRRLDGLPLAIELAAGSLGLLSPAQLRDRLGDAVHTLMRGPRDAPARQRTLEATIDWSVELLEDAERGAFTRFAVFPGGATLDAAQAVTHAGWDVLEGLVDRNLLRTAAETDAEPRLSMLVTVRESALGRLARASDRDDVAERHARWYLDLAEAAEAGLPGIESGKWMRRVAAEMPNFRAAIEWGLQNDPELALRLAAGLGDYWSRIASTEGERLLEAGLARANDDVPAALRAHAWLALSRVFTLEPDRTEEAAVTSLTLSERLGDDRGAAAALAQLSHCAAMTSLENQRSREFAEAALVRAERAGDGALISEALALLSVLRDNIDDMLRTGAAAERLLVEHGRIDRQVQLLTSMGYECLRWNAPGTARPLVRRALAIAEQRDHPVTLGVALGNEGLAALFEGDEPAAETAFRRELDIGSELRVAPLIGEALQGLAALAAARSRHELAAILRGAGSAIDRHLNPVVDEGLERWLTPSRERLGSDRWSDLSRRGSALTAEQAGALATGELAPDAVLGEWAARLRNDVKLRSQPPV
jgi:predicted ATPase/DNA-binding SARP family transcriptional activator